jgi:hypothetical protein
MVFPSLAVVPDGRAFSGARHFHINTQGRNFFHTEGSTPSAQTRRHPHKQKGAAQEARRPGEF